ncbi:MAG: ABC transporter ATP-binding protein, partial [Candidatus Omnitrophica bacterium]|nr:ABC transporter ATP-binding protein [Candidatus Omnitrophota bacterium]
GKSTLLSLIAGLNSPARGLIKLNGFDAKKKPAKRIAEAVGLLFQNPDLMLFCETVEKELAFGPGNKRILPEDISLRLNSILECLHISGHRDDPPFALSMGQRLRAALGAILTMQFPILLLDEPTTGQNIENVARLMNTLKNLSFVKTIIFCTHDISASMKYADRIIVLNKEGSVAVQGSPAEILADIGLLERNAIKIPASAKLAGLLNSRAVERAG